LCHGIVLLDWHGAYAIWDSEYMTRSIFRRQCKNLRLSISGQNKLNKFVTPKNVKKWKVLVLCVKNPWK
jgi:hypothetical protein